MDTDSNTRQFYKNLFSQDPLWSQPYPNKDEAARWLKISGILTQLISDSGNELNRQLRILDNGCGRGWLTNLASLYGHAEGVDPIPESIHAARSLYPHLSFFIGTVKEVNAAWNKEPYDIIISTEVLEHVIDKEGFIEDMISCLRDNGYIIVTTPRAELYDKWADLGYEKQPVEQWLTEKEVSTLFKSYDLIPTFHDRIYVDMAGMSFLHRVSASRKVTDLLSRIKLAWIKQRLRYIAAIYQIWCFQYRKNSLPFRLMAEK